MPTWPQLLAWVKLEAKSKPHTGCTSISFSLKKKLSCDIFAAICHSSCRALQVALLIILKCFMLVKQPLARSQRVSATNTGCESWPSPAADSWNGSVCSGRTANRAECKICMKKWQKVPRCVIAFDQSEEEATLRQGWIRPLSGPSHTERMTSNHYHYSCFIALLNQGWLKKFGLEEKKKVFSDDFIVIWQGWHSWTLMITLVPSKRTGRAIITS